MMENLIGHNDVFISYGRAESKAFATKLHNRLQESGFQVWFDQNDIPLGVDFQNQIDDGIEKAHNFIFIIAPHSVKSEYCLKEIELAVRRNKRIIPILHVEPEGLWDSIHPVIGKINWIYMREKYDPEVPQDQYEAVDNFEQAFSGLVELLHRHEDYVKLHTQILTQALYWERHQKRVEYLLTGENRIQAEKWLKQRFDTQQAPCEPTLLHAEYITESIKNAQGLVTDVFLSYSTQNTEMMEKIKQSLMRNSLTVWTNLTDIRTGVEFQEEINKGIEETTNVVFLLSPDSLESEYCQQELAYATQLKKRIIMLVVAPTDLNTLPPEIRKVQFIDILPKSEDDADETYYKGIDKLLYELHRDRDYYYQHKMLLVKALRWERQNKNPGILLRGHELKNAQAWVRLADKHPDHPMLPIHKEFIEESENQPPDTTADVFLSYSRADGDFCRLLNEQLQLQGKITWFDQESIDFGSDFQSEIFQGIESSDNIVFVISPHAVESEFCVEEVEYAQKLNKRIIPVLYRSVEQDRLPEGLKSVQWIDFESRRGDFQAAFSELVRTLDTDREHVKSHTKWSQRAIEWEAHEKSRDLLLRGREFTAAEMWLTEAIEHHKTPAPTAIQKEFIQTSKDAIEAAFRAKERRRKIMMGAVIAVAVIVSCLAVIALFQRAEAVKQRQIAVINEQEAIKQKAIAEANEKEAIRQKAIAEQEREVAIQNKQEALRQKAIAEQEREIAIQNKQEALRQKKIAEEQRNLAVQGQIKILLDQAKQHRDAMDQLGALIAAIKAGQRLSQAEIPLELQQKVQQMLEELAAEVTEQNRLFPETPHLTSVTFSPDGNRLATATEQGVVQLWEANGKPLRSWQAHSDVIYHVTFSPSGDQLITASADQTMKIWSRTGKLLKTLSGHQDWIWDVAFSPDGNLMASASVDQTIKLWSKTGKLLRTLIHPDEMTGVAFHPSGEILAASGWDGYVTLWNIKGDKIRSFGDPQTSLSAIAFSPDGSHILTGNVNHQIQLWDVEGNLIRTFRGHQSKVTSVGFSVDGNLIISASTDNQIILWRTNGEKVTTFTGHHTKIMDINFSNDNKTIASASEDEVKIWNLENILHPALGKEDGLDALLEWGCNWVADYLRYNPRVSTEDRTLCQSP
ncbi:MAG: TIR domain-containing protein [Gemmatimonadetes bacterium]|nr:MAG: TIR domain-containing protein [Gemmatimonadota bacterium]